jgi:hypothetical protein
MSIRRFLAALAVLAMVFGLASCGGGGSSSNNSGDNSSNGGGNSSSNGGGSYISDDPIHDSTSGGNSTDEQAYNKLISYYDLLNHTGYPLAWQQWKREYFHISPTDKNNFVNTLTEKKKFSATSCGQNCNSYQPTSATTLPEGDFDIKAVVAYEFLAIGNGYHISLTLSTHNTALTGNNALFDNVFGHLEGNLIKNLYGLGYRYDLTSEASAFFTTIQAPPYNFTCAGTSDMYCTKSEGAYMYTIRDNLFPYLPEYDFSISEFYLTLEKQ